MKREFDQSVLDALDAYNKHKEGRYLLEFLETFINEGDIIIFGVSLQRWNYFPAKYFRQKQLS